MNKTHNPSLIDDRLKKLKNISFKDVRIFLDNTYAFARDILSNRKFFFIVGRIKWNDMVYHELHHFTPNMLDVFYKIEYKIPEIKLKNIKRFKIGSNVIKIKWGVNKKLGIFVWEYDM